MNEDRKSTGDLMRLLHEGALSDVVQSADLLPSFPDHLARLCTEREVARERAIQRAQIERFSAQHRRHDIARLDDADHLFNRTFRHRQPRVAGYGQRRYSRCG